MIDLNLSQELFYRSRSNGCVFIYIDRYTMQRPLQLHIRHKQADKVQENIQLYSPIELFACWVIFHAFVVVCRLLFKIIFFKKIFREHYQCVKRFGSRSGTTFCRSCSWSKLFAKFISRRQKSQSRRYNS